MAQLGAGLLTEGLHPPLSRLRNVAKQDRAPAPPVQTAAVDPPAPNATHVEKVPERTELIYARSGNGKFLRSRWSGHWCVVVSKGCPNINSSQLFEELCVQFPGRFNPWQLKTLTKRVKVWQRQDARARGVVIDHLKYRNLRNKPRDLRPDPFNRLWKIPVEPAQ